MLGRPGHSDVSERAWSETAATQGRKRHRATEESAGDADEVSLLSPDKSQRIKGRVGAGCLVVTPGEPQ